MICHRKAPYPRTRSGGGGPPEGRGRARAPTLNATSANFLFQIFEIHVTLLLFSLKRRRDAAGKSMSMVDQTAARARRRPTDEQRRIERARIAEQWLAGFGLAAIADAQSLRSERVRRIIREIEEIGPAGRRSDFALLQLDRLRPALRAAM